MKKVKIIIILVVIALGITGGIKVLSNRKAKDTGVSQELEEKKDYILKVLTVDENGNYYAKDQRSSISGQAIGRVFGGNAGSKVCPET